MALLAEDLAGSEDFESARAESTVEGLVCFGLGKGIRDSESHRVTVPCRTLPRVTANISATEIRYWYYS